MKKRTVELLKRRTAIFAVVAAVLVLGLIALAFRGSSGSNQGGGSEQPISQTDVLKNLNNPKQSGLNPKLASQLANLGTKVVVADVTGIGRELFPDYWANGQYRPCCDAIQIQGAGSRASGAHPGYIDVIVAWSARRLNGGPPLTRQVETITFHKVGANWQPVPPQYLNP